MTMAKTGDKVRVHYTGSLNTGEVFDSSREREPLEFTLGEHHVISGFENAVLGMTVGETRIAAIEPAEGYGPFVDDLVQQVERSMLPDGLDLEVGQRLQASQPNQPPMILTVVDLDDETVTLDGNHPLAGKDLTFEIELVAIV